MLSGQSHSYRNPPFGPAKLPFCYPTMAAAPVQELMTKFSRIMSHEVGNGGRMTVNHAGRRFGTHLVVIASSILLVQLSFSLTFYRCLRTVENDEKCIVCRYFAHSKSTMQREVEMKCAPCIYCGKTETCEHRIVGHHRGYPKGFHSLRHNAYLEELAEKQRKLLESGATYSCAEGNQQDETKHQK
ncbi:hypothetical protein Tcan_01668 [Toxocara canis]|uniref:Uncharacterized protein n=1 Tax=Toxocara canis TaxID=6265 RepID=A0A0B2VPQ8_TOXCA|nr:hypothetical protein Tcan_01668 [Toxocara canis]